MRKALEILLKTLAKSVGDNSQRDEADRHNRLISELRANASTRWTKMERIQQTKTLRDSTPQRWCALCYRRLSSAASSTPNQTDLWDSKCTLLGERSFISFYLLFLRTVAISARLSHRNSRAFFHPCIVTRTEMLLPRI